MLKEVMKVLMPILGTALAALLGYALLALQGFLQAKADEATETDQ